MALVSRSGTARLSTEFGVWNAVAVSADAGDHVALWMGDLAEAPLRVRIQSACLTGTALLANVCDCRLQLHTAMRDIAVLSRGLVVYLAQEGRGLGLVEKINGVLEMNRGADTVDAYETRGIRPDVRDYRDAVELMRSLNVNRQIELITNNPAKVAALSAVGYQVTRQPASVGPVNNEVAKYLETKRDRLGHLIGQL